MKKKFECVACGKKFDLNDALGLHTAAMHEKISTSKRLLLAKKSVLIYALFTAVMIIILAIAEYTK